MNEHNQDRMLSRDELAEFLGCATSSIDEWCNPVHKRYISGFPKKHRYGHRAVGFRYPEVLEYLERRRAPEDRHE